MIEAANDLADRAWCRNPAILMALVSLPSDDEDMLVNLYVGVAFILCEKRLGLQY